MKCHRCCSRSSLHSTVPSSGKSGDSFNALLAAPAAGVHSSSPLQEAKKALIQWTVTLADVPCGGCPTLAILVMFVGMKIGCVGMPGARYLTRVSLLQHPAHRGFHQSGSHSSRLRHWCTRHKRRNPHKVIDRSHKHRTKRSR